MFTSLSSVFNVVFGWFVAFLVIWFIGRIFGVGRNQLPHSCKKVIKLRRYVLKETSLAKAQKLKTLESAGIMSTIARRYRIIDKLINMYVFDNPENMLVLAANKAIDQVPEICRRTYTAIISGEETDVFAVLGEISVILKDAEVNLEEAIRKNRQDKLVKF